MLFLSMVIDIMALFTPTNRTILIYEAVELWVIIAVYLVIHRLLYYKPGMGFFKIHRLR